MSKSKLSNLLKGKSVPNISAYASPWTKQDKDLMKAVELGNVKKVATLLFKKAIITTKLGPKGKSVFHCACEIGNKQVVDLILSKTQDINDTTCQGITALQSASARGHAYTVEKLLQQHASVDQRDSNDMTALHHACAGQYLECIHILLHANANVQLVDQGGKTPLHYSAHKGGPNCVQICKWLLERGAIVDWQDKDKVTPLMLAAKEGHKEVCDFLLRRGANPQLKDKEGYVALELGLKKGHKELEDVFEKASLRSFESNSERGSLTSPSESGSMLQDHVDTINMLPLLRSHTGRGIMSNQNVSRTDIHSLHSFHSMDDALLSNHRDSPDQSYKELKEEHEQLNNDYSTLSIENLRLRDKVESLQHKLAEKRLQETHLEPTNEFKSNYDQQINILKEQLLAEQKKVQLLESLVRNQDLQGINRLKETTEDIKMIESVEEDDTDCLDEAQVNQEKINLNKSHHDYENESSLNLLKDISASSCAEDSSLYQQQILSFKEEISHLQAELTLLKQDKSNDDESLSAELINKNTALATEVAMLQQEVTSLQTALEVLQIEVPTEAQRLDAVLESSRNFEEVNFDEEGFVEGRDVTKEEFLQGQNQQLRAQCNLLTSELEKLRATFDAILKAGDNLQVDYDQLAIEKDALQDDLEAALKEKTAFATENEYLLNDTKELHENLNRLVHELEKIQEKYTATLSENDELKRSVTIATKVGEVARLLEERDTLMLRCKEFEETTERLQHDHGILLEEVQSLNDIVAQMTTERDQMALEIEELCQNNQDINQLEYDYEELLKENLKLQEIMQSADRKNAAETSVQHGSHNLSEHTIKQDGVRSQAGPQTLEHDLSEHTIKQDGERSQAGPQALEHDLSEHTIKQDGVRSQAGPQALESTEQHAREVEKLKQEVSLLLIQKEELETELKLLKASQTSVPKLKEKEVDLMIKDENIHLTDELKQLEQAYSQILKERDQLIIQLQQSNMKGKEMQNVNQLRKMEQDYNKLLEEKIEIELKLADQIDISKRTVDKVKFQQLEEDYKNLLDEKSELESHLMDLSEKTDLAMKVDHKKLAEENAELKLKLEQFTQAQSEDKNFQELEENYRTVIKEKEDLDVKLRESSAQMKAEGEYYMQLKQLEIDFVELLGEKESLELELKNQLVHLQKIEYDYTGLVSENQELKERIESQNSTEESGRCKHLEHEIHLLLKEKEVLEHQLTTDHAKLQQAEHDLGEVLNEKEMMEQQLTNDQQKVQQLEQEVATLLRERESSKQQNIGENNKSLNEQEYVKFEEDLKYLQDEKEQMEIVIYGLSRHNVAIEKKVEDLKKALASELAAMANLKEKHQALVEDKNSQDEEMQNLQDEILRLKTTISKLKAQINDWEKKHADTVTTYRTHLLSAVQGHMDPDVKNALYHIIEIRTEFDD